MAITVFRCPQCGDAIESALGHICRGVTAGGTSVLSRQVGGDHYRTLGDYQPWKVLHATMSPDEFRGYMIGTAQAYLIRNKENRRQDIEKAMHTLQGWLELTEGEQ